MPWWTWRNARRPTRRGAVPAHHPLHREFPSETGAPSQRKSPLRNEAARAKRIGASSHGVRIGIWASVTECTSASVRTSRGVKRWLPFVLLSSVCPSSRESLSSRNGSPIRYCEDLSASNCLGARSIRAVTTKVGTPRSLTGSLRGPAAHTRHVCATGSGLRWGRIPIRRRATCIGESSWTATRPRY